MSGLVDYGSSDEDATPPSVKESELLQATFEHSKHVY